MNDDSKSSPKFFKWAYVAGACTNLASALSVSVNTLLVALGANPFQIAIVNSAKLLGQTFSQVFGLHFINLFSSHRKSQMWALSIELVFKLGLAIIVFTNPKFWFPLIVGVSLTLGLLGYTVFLTYYSWMGEIVPKNLKDKFFANRSMAGEVLTILGFLAASWWLKLNKPTLFLLGFLYLANYLVRNIEVFSYILHPDSIREKIIKNHIIKRMREPLKDISFVSFATWYNFVNTASTLNVLFLEFFIIHILNLKFYWIPLSFVIMALGGMLGLFISKAVFPKVSKQHKLTSVSALLAVSSAIWLLAHSPVFLVIALVLAGISDNVVTLVQRVEVINYAEKKDKDGYYATFNTAEYVISAIAVLALGSVQKSVFSFNLIFFITIPVTLLSLLFIKKASSPLREV